MCFRNPPRSFGCPGPLKPSRQQYPRASRRRRSVSSPAPQGKRGVLLGWGDFRPRTAGLPSGRKTWVLQYRDAGGRTRRHPIGQASAIDPAAARKLAGDLLRRVAGGANPSVERRQARKAATVGDIFEAYLTHAEKEQRHSSFDQTRRNLRKYAARLHREAVTDIDRAAVSRLHQFLGTEVGRVQANRVLASLSAAWVWALRTGLVGGDNPAAYVPKFSEKPRDRVLAPDELRLIWRCTASEGSYNRIVRTLLLTACRRQEIGGMRWGEIEGDVLVVPAARMKRGRPHEVPLTPLALAQLPERRGDACVFSSGDVGFEGWSGAKKALDRRIADLGTPLPTGDFTTSAVPSRRWRTSEGLPTPI